MGRALELCSFLAVPPRVNPFPSMSLSFFINQMGTENLPCHPQVLFGALGRTMTTRAIFQTPQTYA